MHGFHGVYRRIDLTSGLCQDVALPDRFLEEALTEGASRGASLPRSRLRKMIRHYNVSRGWTDDGYLPDAVLKDLALETTGKTIT